MTEKIVRVFQVYTVIPVEYHYTVFQSQKHVSSQFPPYRVYTIRTEPSTTKRQKESWGEKRKIITKHPPLSALSSHLHPPRSNVPQPPGPKLLSHLEIASLGLEDQQSCQLPLSQRQRVFSARRSFDRSPGPPQVAGCLPSAMH